MQNPGTGTFGYAEYCIKGKTQICKFCGSVPGDSSQSQVKFAQSKLDVNQIFRAVDPLPASIQARLKASVVVFICLSLCHRTMYLL